MYNQKPLPGDLLDYGNSLSQGLVGFWLFNEGSGNIVQDLSGNGNTGTFVNSPSWVSGKYGYAVDFDESSSQYLSISSPILTVPPMTFVCWFKVDVLPSVFDESYYLMQIGPNAGAEYDAFALSIGTDDKLTMSSGTVSFVHAKSSTAITQTGVWYQAIGETAAPNSRKVYLNNGGEGTNAETREPVIATLKATYVGTRYGNGLDHYLDGTICHVLIYNRILTVSEKAQLYRESFCMVRTKRRRIIYDEIAGVPPTTFPYYYREIASRRIA